MTGLFVVLAGVVVSVLGAAAFAVPRDTSDAFERTADRTGLPAGLYNPKVVRFTAMLFIVGGVVLAIIGVTMVGAGR